eukprot:scaffold12097_cov25-Prasinocladus_malaysianus.AAC.4
MVLREGWTISLANHSGYDMCGYGCRCCMQLLTRVVLGAVVADIQRFFQVAVGSNHLMAIKQRHLVDLTLEIGSRIIGYLWHLQRYLA